MYKQQCKVIKDRSAHDVNTSSTADEFFYPTGGVVYGTIVVEVAGDELENFVPGIRNGENGIYKSLDIKTDFKKPLILLTVDITRR